MTWKKILLDGDTAGGGIQDFYYYRKYGTDIPEGWYTAPCVATTFTTGSPTANLMRAIPFICPKTITLDRISVNVTTGATGKARLGIYKAGTNINPVDLILDAGEVDTAVLGTKTITINQTLEGNNLYWLTYVSNAVIAVRCFSVASLISILGYSEIGTTPWYAVATSWTYQSPPTSLPNPFGSIQGLVAAPIPIIRVRLSA